MEKNIPRLAEAGTKEKQRGKNRYRIMTVLACLVVFFTTYALILPAITMDSNKRLLCSEESLSGHVHTDACRDESGKISCGYADFVLHSHSKSCYDGKGSLICTLAEVVESQSGGQSEVTAKLMKAENEASADEAQSPDDVQQEAEQTPEQEPMQKENPVCVQLLAGTAREELPVGQTLHTHTEDCFDENHALVCGKVQLLQHQHTDECFADTEPGVKGESAVTSGGKRTMSFRGTDYSVAVTFTEKADLPQDVELAVEEILPGSAAYDNYFTQAENALPEDRGLFFCRFFDISFLVNGVEVEPKDSVDVEVSYDEAIPLGQDLTCNAVHFAEEGVEVLPATVQENKQGNDAIVFSQDSFSVVGTAISALNLNDGSYIFYKDGYALGANQYGPIAIKVTVDENGYVKPANSNYNIDMITWTYQNGGLQSKSQKTYLTLGAYGASLYNSSQKIDARIINNAVRFSYDAGTHDSSTGRNLTYYLGMSGGTISASSTFANGDYFLAAKVENVDDTILTPGDLEIADDIRGSGCLKPKVRVSTDGAVLKYTWYRSDDGENWKEVERVRVTGDSYNMAADGSSLNVALDKGANKFYKVVLTEINGNPCAPLESQPFQVPYYDSIQNGDFENPKISTDVEDPEHYQPLLPNGTAGMVWKTTAGDGKIEYISVDSTEFKKYSTNWHNCESAASGVQYVELNAGMEGALYQDVLTVPGSTMYWSLAHRGRGVGKANISDADNTKDTMYVVILSTVLAEKYNITTQEAVQRVLDNPSAYPGARVEKITDTSLKWVYHNGDYTVPDDQYLTRYFFVAGETAFDKYKDASASNLAMTVGNHLDDIHFSTELPPPTSGKVNLFVEKTIVGLDEEEASQLMQNLTFTLDGTTITGTQFQNFRWDEDKGGYTAMYQMQLDIGSATYVSKTVRENTATAEVDGFDRTTTVAVNRGNAAEGTSGTVRIQNKNSGLISFTNSYTQKMTTLRLKKVDERGVTLPGAVFRLEKQDGSKWTTSYDNIRMDDEGYVELLDLEYDKLYRLTEVTAPSGYTGLLEPIYFKIEAGPPMPIPCDAKGNQLDQWPELVKTMSGGTVPGLEITNKPGMVLPETGGSGTRLLYIAGACMLVLSIAMMGFTRKNRKEDL